MDSEDRQVVRADANPASDTSADTASSTLVGTNILGINAGTFPGGIVGPAAEIAADESANETDPGLLGSDLTGGARRKRETGDDGVSPQQRELESGELNG